MNPVYVDLFVAIVGYLLAGSVVCSIVFAIVFSVWTDFQWFFGKDPYDHNDYHPTNSETSDQLARRKAASLYVVGREDVRDSQSDR